MKSIQPEHSGSVGPVPSEPGRSQLLPLRASHVTAALPAPCFNCTHRQLCLPGAVDDKTLHDLDGAVLGQRRLHRGQVLYREGDAFQHLYAVRSGTIKLSVAAGEEHDQVIRACMPGDIFGLDGIASDVFGTTAMALEDSLVCSVSFATLMELARRRSQWQERLCHAMAAEVAREQRHLVLLGSYRTDARVAAFLLELSRRFEKRGYSTSDFYLRLSRADIGSYLGVTLETISRTLSAFQHSGWIEVHKRHIRLLDVAALQRIAALVRHDRSQ